MVEIDNNNSIVNLSNSILKNFGVEPFHNTISEIDNLLKGHKKVVVMLFDGMGTAIRNKHQKECEFIRSGFVHKMKSTFPPTTVAATTGFLTAKFPIESGWMSWTQYLAPYKCNVDVFRNRNPLTDELIRPREEGLVLFDICPKVFITELINRANEKEIAYSQINLDKNATGIWPLHKKRVNLNKLLKEKEEIFDYFYLGEPDHTIHTYGTTSKKVSRKIKRLNRFAKKVVEANPDTLFIVIADHGLVDVDIDFIDKNEDILATLNDDLPISMEKRCPTFFVKEGQKEQFVSLFNKYYGEHFDLLSKEEVLEIHIFGEGTPNEHFNEFVGDFLAISKDSHCIYDSRVASPFYPVASHAGGTNDEMDIDISVFNR